MSAPRVKALNGGGMSGVMIPIHRCVKRGGTGESRRKGAEVIAWAVVDEQDAHRLRAYFWRQHIRGYAVATIEGQFVMMHHLVIGKPPDGTETSHLNADRLDNRRGNLEHVLKSVNLANPADGPQASKVTCGFRGVGPNAGRTKWNGRVQILGKSYRTAWFDTPEEANEALIELRAQVTPYDERA